MSLSVISYPCRGPEDMEMDLEKEWPLPERSGPVLGSRDTAMQSPQAQEIGPKMKVNYACPHPPTSPLQGQRLPLSEDIPQRTHKTHTFLVAPASLSNAKEIPAMEKGVGP